MSVLTSSARGASAYAYPNHSPYQPFHESDFPTANDNGTFTRHWNSIIDELLRIRKLPDDWDGEGTSAPDPALVDWAITLAQAFRAKGIIAPDRTHVGVNATIYFEWMMSSGYTEIEVVSPAEAECRSVRKGSTDSKVLYLTRPS